MTIVGLNQLTKVSESNIPAFGKIKNETQKVYNEKTDSFDNSGKKKINKKAVIAGTSVIAGIIAGICAVKNGKAQKLMDGIKTKINKVKNKPLSTENTSSIMDGPLSMEKMRSKYKTSTIMDGPYLKRCPEYYTGQVVAKAKNGNSTILDYEGGAIKKAVTKNPAGEVVLEKLYDGRYSYEELGTDFVPIITKKADGSITKAAIGNYELSYGESYPKFLINSKGETKIQSGFEKLLGEGTELGYAVDKIKKYMEHHYN